MNNDLEEARQHQIDECLKRRAELMTDLPRLQAEFDRTRNDPSEPVRFCAESNLQLLKDRIAQTHEEERRLKSRPPKIPMDKQEYWVKFSIGIEFDQLVLWYRGDVVSGVYCTDFKYLRLGTVDRAAKRVGLRVPARWYQELWAMQCSHDKARDIVRSGSWENGPKRGWWTQNW